MASYYVNSVAQLNGDHEVHAQGCSYMPAEANRIPLGSFEKCNAAVVAAGKYFTQVNGCYFCSNACHTQ